MKSFLAKFATFFGYLFIVFSSLLMIQRYNPSRMSFNNYAPSLERACRNTPYLPRIIRIPSLGKELPIIPSTIDDDKWSTTDKGVSFLTSSKLPGERGNSVLYGHNWESILGDLEKVKPGSEIQIEFSNGVKRTFIIQVTGTVSPDQTNILKETQDKRITLYTCTGFLDSQRFVVVATLENETVALRKD